MAEKQYIGARYVPKFFVNGSGTAEWTSNTQYEALTVVTRNGNSYTSKVPVPASVGAPEDNPDYWVSTGIYNEQIEAYREDVGNLEDTLNDYIESANTLANRKFLFIGDSYLEGYTPDGSVTGWGTILVSILGLTSSQYEIRYSGGAGFVANGQGKNFGNLLNDATGEDFTDILVAGGYNDKSASEANIASAISNFVSAAKLKYPNAKVWVAHVGWSNKSSNIYDLSKSVRNYIAGCGACGAAYITNSEFSLRNYQNSYASDGIHANSTGQNLIARNLANGILTGSCDVYIPFASCTFTPVSAIGNNNLGQLACTIHNGIATISTASVLNWAYPTAVNFGAASGANLIEIADITSSLIVGNAYNNLAIPVQLAIQDDGTYHNANGNLIFKGNKLYLSVMDVNDAGSSWRTFNSVTYVNVMRFACSFDSLFC